MVIYCDLMLAAVGIAPLKSGEYPWNSLPGNSGKVVSVGTNNPIVVSCGKDGAIDIWDLATPDPLPAGDRIIVNGSEDGTINHSEVG